MSHRDCGRALVGRWSVDTWAVRILISVMPFAGHVRPIANLTATLIGRGHAVTVYTGNHYRDRFDQLGASVVTWRTAPDFDETDVSATFPETGRPGFRGVLGNFEHIFIRTGAAQARDLAREIDTHTYPVIVGDSLSLGAGLAAEQRNLPWVSIAVMPNTYPAPFRRPACACGSAAGGPAELGTGCCGRPFASSAGGCPPPTGTNGANSGCPCPDHGSGTPGSPPI